MKEGAEQQFNSSDTLTKTEIITNEFQIVEQTRTCLCALGFDIESIDPLEDSENLYKYYGQRIFDKLFLKNSPNPVNTLTQSNGVVSESTQLRNVISGLLEEASQSNNLYKPYGETLISIDEEATLLDAPQCEYKFPREQYKEIMDYYSNSRQPIPVLSSLTLPKLLEAGHTVDYMFDIAHTFGANGIDRNVGDKLIVDTISAIYEKVKDTHFIVQYGGDEFLLVRKNSKRIGKLTEKKGYIRKRTYRGYSRCKELVQIRRYKRK